MQFDADYGTKKIVQKLDDEGSSKTTEYKNYRGAPVYPIEEVVEIREKITSPANLAVSVNALLKEMDTNSRVISGGYRIEGYNDRVKKGYYYVVKCYTAKVWDK